MNAVNTLGVRQQAHDWEMQMPASFALLPVALADALRETLVPAAKLAALRQLAPRPEMTDAEICKHLLEGARKAFAEYCYGKALRLLAIVLAVFPQDADALALAARTYERNRQFAQAASLWDAAIAAAPEQAAAYAGLARALALQGMTTAAAGILSTALARLSPRIPDILLILRQWLELELGEFLPEAASALANLPDNLPETHDLRLWHNLVYGYGPKALAQYADAMLAIGDSALDRSGIFLKTMSCLARLADMDGKYAALRYKLLARALGECRRITQPAQFSKPLAFILHPFALRFYEPVIRQFDPAEAEIVISRADKNDAPTLSGCDLINDYAISYGPEHFNKYKCIVLDSSVHHTPPPGQLVIGVAHAVDAYFSGSWLETHHGIICMSRSYATGTGLELAGDEYKLVSALLPEAKCEKTYSGPYHASSGLGMDREELRARICAEYDVADDRPFLFFLEDELCQRGQIAHCARKLSKHFHVFFKPLTMLANPALMARLGRDVHLVTSKSFGNNVLRFGCDCILASFYSGSALTSAMLGLNLICYYSIYYRSPASAPCERAHVDNFILTPPLQPNGLLGFGDAKNRLLRLLRDHGMLFNLLQPERMRYALQSGEIAAFYKMHRAEIENVFGHFYKKNAHLRTAELIRRFALNGSFGADCVAVHIKKPGA